MSETVRRRKYRYDRVLIETARVLSPQFDDAVVFLSGSQIEMLRNVAQYLRRLETYVTVYNPGYYLAPTVEEYDSILAIVADLEETLMGNPNTIWGYKDRFMQSRSAQSTGDPYTDVQTVAVPAGEVYVLEQWTVRHEGGTTCDIAVSVHAGGEPLMLYTVPALSSGVYVPQAINLTLKEGDYVRLRVIGLPNTTYAYLRVWGHMMEIPV